jgi:DNA-binding MarR family transcriptional regulator
MSWSDPRRQTSDIADDFRTMPGYLIRRAHQTSSALFAQETAGFDLTSVQYAALSAISRTPAVDATRLSALISFDRSTLGDVLERMELKGWIVRSPAPEDKRVKLISLTSSGETLLNTVQPAVRRVQERLLSPFSSSERQQVLQLLSRLGDAYQESEAAD